MVPVAPKTDIQSAHALLGQIGNTPLIRLAKVDEDLPGVEIYAKAEFFNPGGSVKDRAGLSMIQEGERSGALTKDHVLLDATSGNTGIAYAMICAIKGYRAKLVLPANASHERKQILKAYGAEMVFSDPGEGSDGRGEILLSRPVRQPRQLARAFRGHRRRNHPPDRRPRDALRHQHGDQRNLHRHLAALEARRAGREVHFGAAVIRIPRPGGFEAHAHRHRAGDL
jgi:Pyridoxal-phosphate dependent enzyme